MRVVAVIPARYGSSRFPGKPLAKIFNKPMIQYVYERVKRIDSIDEVIIATDHQKIYEVVENFGGKPIMTKISHESGSDRVEEISQLVEGDIFLNVQGDEPLINEKLINEVVEESKKCKDAVITAKKLIEEERDIINPNIVKVVTDLNNYALYFSRSPIPYNRLNDDINYYKHIGIYCYPKTILQNFIKMKKSKYENIEMLEQLRLLENGYRVKVLETGYDSIGVDVPEDIKKVENNLEVK